MERVLAIDIGGTKMAVGEVEADGHVVRRHVIPTRTALSADELLADLLTQIDRLAPFDRFVACGVGCAGPMTAGGLEVSPINIEAWRDFPLRDRLAAHVGIPTAVDNDAKALAIAEGWVGGAIGVRDYLAMVVSTGVGGGIVLDGRLLDGRLGNAGHIGQMVVVPGGAQLPGQVRGGLESEASGRAIARRTELEPREVGTAEITRVGTMVGRAAGSVANLLDLSLVVIGGSVAMGFGEPFFSAVRREVTQVCVLDHSRETRVEPSGLAGDGPLIGAAAVGLRSLGQRPGGLV